MSSADVLIPPVAAYQPSVYQPTAPSQAVPLVDNWQRRLTYLRLSVTDVCNFRCSYCLPNGYSGKPAPALTLAEISTLLAGFAALGMTKVRLTGGEPATRQDLADIIAQAANQTGVRTVALSSNGYKLGSQVRRWQAAGLNQLNISVDSFDAPTFQRLTGMDVLPRLLADIDSALALAMTIKLNGVLFADTAFDTLQGALAFVKTRPVTYRFIELMQTRDNVGRFFAKQPASLRERLVDYLLQNGWQPQPRAQDAGPAIEYAHADFVGKIGIIAPYAEHFCDTCNRLRVSSTGKLHLCLFDSVNHDLRPWLQANDVAGLMMTVQNLMAYKPPRHQLQQQDSGLMHNLSLIGG